MNALRWLGWLCVAVVAILLMAWIERGEDADCGES